MSEQLEQLQNATDTILEDLDRMIIDARLLDKIYFLMIDAYGDFGVSNQEEATKKVIKDGMAMSLMLLGFDTGYNAQFESIATKLAERTPANLLRVLITVFSDSAENHSPYYIDQASYDRRMKSVIDIFERRITTLHN